MGEKRLEGKKMKGTEKQIAWAQDIRSQAIENIESNIKLNAERYEEFDHHPMYAANVESYKIMRAVIEGIYEAHDDAEYIINHRTILSPSGYTVHVNRWAEMILSGKKTVEQIAKENGLKNYQA
jgi:hypothetical protein